MANGSSMEGRHGGQAWRVGMAGRHGWQAWLARLAGRQAGMAGRQLPALAAIPRGLPWAVGWLAGWLPPQPPCWLPLWSPTHPPTWCLLLTTKAKAWPQRGRRFPSCTAVSPFCTMLRLSSMATSSASVSTAGPRGREGGRTGRARSGKQACERGLVGASISERGGGRKDRWRSGERKQARQPARIDMWPWQMQN